MALGRIARREAPVFVALLFGACAIWIRDRAWFADAADILPILLGFGLIWLIGSPWNPRLDRLPTGSAYPLAGLGVMVVGLASDLTLLLALGWTILLGRWLYCSFECGAAKISRLCFLALCCFPWLANDFKSVGWWYRLSGSWANAKLFEVSGFFVRQQGTSIAIEGLPVDVAEACSGVNVLQSMLVAGTAIALLECGRRRCFWLAIASLPALAWFANSLRISLLVAAGLTFGPGFASGWFHTWGSMVVIFAMISVSWLGFRWLGGLGSRWSGGGQAVPCRSSSSLPPAPAHRGGGGPGILAPLAVAVYCGYMCRSLVLSWADDPFNRHGSIAMALWVASIVAIGWSSLRPGRRLHPAPCNSLNLGGLVLTAIGTAGGLNVLQHVGLAFALASFLPSHRSRILMILLASTWMPAYGWLGNALFQTNLDWARLPVVALGCLLVFWWESDLRAGRRAFYPGAPATATRSRFQPHLYLVLVVVAANIVWESRELPTAGQRLVDLPRSGSTFTSEDIPLSGDELSALGGSEALRRIYVFGEQKLLVSCLDGSRNRSAVHDPTYCLRGAGWELKTESTVPLPNGEAKHIVAVRNNEVIRLLCWFSDGTSSYQSMFRYWLDTTVRRITLGASGEEPILFAVQIPSGEAGGQDLAAITRDLMPLLGL